MRLVDADALHIKIELTPCYVCESGRKKQYGTKMNKTVRFGPGETLLLYEDVSTLILEAPIIGADLVRHGRWIDGRPYTNSRWKVCSECHKSAHHPAGGDAYCPHCGSKMDGGDPHD